MPFFKPKLPFIPVYLNSSLKEGQVNAKSQSENATSEYDFMCHIRNIIVKRESDLEPIENAPLGYYRIRSNHRSISSPATTTTTDAERSNVSHYVNGYQLKKDMQMELEKYNPRQMKSSANVDGASVYVEYRRSLRDERVWKEVEEFRTQLSDVQRDQAKRNMDVFFQFSSDLINLKSREFYMKCSSDVLHTPMPEFLLNKVCRRMPFLNHLYKTMFLSLIGIPIPQKLAEKLQLALNFYEKYSSHINREIESDRVRKHRRQYMESKEECDIVIGIKLDFIPSLVRDAFERIKRNRPAVYRQIKHINIYLIPKWSKKTSESEAEYEFRLSFSLIESELANRRTKNEKILNGIARSIYYKYLNRTRVSFNDEIYFKSYYIKTIVLWMCEQINFENVLKRLKDDEETIAIELTKRFLDYTLQLLSSYTCPHYFISGINLFEEYPPTFLDRIANILKHEVRLPKKREEPAERPCEGTCCDVLKLLIQTPEMVNEFDQLQNEHFDCRMEQFVSNKYDHGLNM
ncbi:unnamed protein product [Didymodactylos carnosus]|uniref:Mab-21-like HhH/H2TH-like domain-containing protein n=1 Tax=Didymodactylos carnosus TaxID=1234261 RepID=A0A8S2J100_9BILA|nr:unnamed protein product [Didymodactylos carnosus]CAF3777501.1 unnamed protein product [Didymodactylos carnosus]